MIHLRAAAKINLTLDVLFRRDDGYHEVDMILQSVSLYDELTVEDAAELSLIVEGDAPASQDNLVLRAANLLKNHARTDRGAVIFLKKQIPTAAGLGGGSADAAATLVGLCRLWGLSLSNQQLSSLGAELGADIPFCITGGTMRATGIGTDLTSLPHPPPVALLICKPCDGVSTKEVYQSLRLDGKSGCQYTKNAVGFLETSNSSGLFSSMGNALESVTVKMRPEVAKTIETMRELGALAAQMSGSGPSVFGVFKTKADAERAGKQLPGFVCEPVREGIIIQ